MRVCVCATSTDWAAWRSETTCPRGRSSSLSCSSAAGLPGNLLTCPRVAPLLPPFKVLPMRWLLVCCLFISFAIPPSLSICARGTDPPLFPLQAVNTLQWLLLTASRNIFLLLLSAAPAPPRRDSRVSLYKLFGTELYTVLEKLESARSTDAVDTVDPAGQTRRTRKKAASFRSAAVQPS